jgi:probable HAF family extracellular repeat protein
MRTLLLYAVLVLALGAPRGAAQVRPGAPGWMRGLRSSAAPAAGQAADITPAASPAYKFTVFGFPNTLNTNGFGINSGAANSKIEIVGAIGNQVANPIGYSGGFRMNYAQSKGVTTESFRSVNISGAAQQMASAVNDSGEIVGQWSDSSGVIHGYLQSGGTFSIIDVPFPGANLTAAFGINNSGQIVGFWADATTSHGFLLSGGTYTTFDYPGAVFTVPNAINNNGEIDGFYGDIAGVYHGFSLSGGSYTSLDPPGSMSTEAYGINDAGDVVGVYCRTTECATNFDTFQGFVLSGGTYKTISIPGATETAAVEINNAGSIVGTYITPVGRNGFLAVPK